MLSYVHDVLRRAESSRDVRTRADAFREMRSSLGLDDFGEVLLGMPHADYPKLSGLLPAMAPEAVQELWTGSSGEHLLRQSCGFVRALMSNYLVMSGKSLGGARVLDYGSGYGRLARLMWYYVDEKDLFGVDPWEESLSQCRQAGMGPNFFQSDYVPKFLPVPAADFDLAYAFSVFTHLSQRSAEASLAAVRACMRVGGVFCVTIRPPEYWDLPTSSAAPEDERKILKQKQIDEGFAYYPYPRQPPVDGEITYGDTGMSFEMLGRLARGWELQRIDRSLEDPYQIYVFLRAV